MRWAAALAVAVVGCTVDGNPPNAPALANVDFNDFACKVQPIVARRCAMPACHGRPEHAFRVYAPARLRLAPVATAIDRDAPLTLAEAQANFASAQGMTFGAATPDDVPLLHKTLAPSLGGGEHKGGVIFRDPNDPDYLALRAWVAGETLPGGCDLVKKLQGGP